MELDTGAAVSIMPFKQFKKRLPSTSYRSTDVTLRTYTGALVRPCGVAVVNVQHSGRTAQLPLYLVDQAGPPLLGREWLHTLRLDWDSIWGLNYISRGQPKWMPAVVMAQTGPVSFKVRVSTPSGCLEWRRHKNQLLQSTTVPAENVVQDDEFSAGPHSDLGSGPAAENSVEGDGFTVGPHSDPFQYHQLVFLSHHRCRRLTPHGVTRIDATQLEIVDHLIGSKQERELW
ncbi:uncharacterized protein LOC142587182 [Dermacentor variabilis]|uniref:uncharacterized protein LOC142587182 n=1 Tax=Dermacentor variabilis TaxID=34621 RepID=UPI003F5B18AC